MHPGFFKCVDIPPYQATHKSRKPGCHVRFRWVAQRCSTNQKHPGGTRNIIHFSQFLGALLVLVLTVPCSLADSCDPIRTFADGKQPLREVFVSPTGSDSAGDGAQGNPYRTIGRALQGARPGDAVRLLPGTHAPGVFISNLSGTSNAPIWLGGVPGLERPRIEGGSTALHLSMARYVVVENIEVSGAAANGINCDDGGDYANTNATHHILFRNLFIHDIGTGGNQDALKLSGVYDYTVLDCEFARMSAGGSGIDHVGCHRGLIARCVFTDAGSNAIQCKGGSADIEIRWNRIINGGMRAVNLGGSTGFEFFRPPLSVAAPNVEARNIRVIANLFQGSDTPVAFVGAVDSLVANNTIVRPKRWLLRVLQETTSSDGYTFLPCGQNEFVNNLVCFDRSQISTYVNIGPNTDAASFRFANNLWYAFDRQELSRPALPAPETNGVYGLDPLFKAPGAGDFSLLTNSPAAGKGRRLPRVWADLAERCYANPPTIGAFEANPPPAGSADADGDSIPDLWEADHGLDRDNPTDSVLDPDGDRLTNFGEYIAGSNPNDPASTFDLYLPRMTALGFTFQIRSVLGRKYSIESVELGEAGNWTEIVVVPGTGEELAFCVLTAAGAGIGRVFRARVSLSR